MNVAIVRADGLVATIVDAESVARVSVPEGCVAVPAADLPAGWQYAPPPVPPTITARQIRLWLISHGVSLPAVESAIDAITDQQQREMVRVEWEYAPYVERAHPMLVPLAAALGLSEAQVDGAFREAASL
jgi:hypothetical protein